LKISNFRLISARALRAQHIARLEFSLEKTIFLILVHIDKDLQGHVVPLAYCHVNSKKPCRGIGPKASICHLCHVTSGVTNASLSSFLLEIKLSLFKEHRRIVSAAIYPIPWPTMQLISFSSCYVLHSNDFVFGPDLSIVFHRHLFRICSASGYPPMASRSMEFRNLLLYGLVLYWVTQPLYQLYCLDGKRV
jgi:hypothetical protein